jgi:hypothetical protein
MANMNPPDAWRDQANLTEYLARQLVDGRLGLFLGAGISKSYGLPTWADLLDRLRALHDQPPLEKGDDLIEKATALKARYYRAREAAYIDDVERVLYDGVSLDLEKLRKIDLLSSIGSLVMASRRGSASQVITLNFDDLLEIYLEFHGFMTDSVISERFWASKADVTIYHPHGLIPLAKRARSKSIVLGTADFLEIMQQGPWRHTLLGLMRSRTFLYMGLSGRDIHLQSLLLDLKKSHASVDDRIAFHGVRFAVKGDEDMKDILDEVGVYTCELETHDHLPHFLFGICQKAREIRMA